MDKRKLLKDQTMEERLAGLSMGAGMPGMQKADPAMRPIDTRVTQDDSDRARMVQQLLLQNSPTAGMPAPSNAQQLMGQDMDQQSQLDELMAGEPEEMTPEKATRFQKLFGR